jgi:hypothetical protein
MTKIAGFVGSGPVKAAPTSFDPSALHADAPPPPAATEVTPAVDHAPDPPKKKRGFWSKLFGIGGQDDRKHNDPPKKPGGER